MNNNRLLVTIEHEHTRRRLSLSLSPSLSVFLSLTHTNSIFSVIYEHIEIPFHSSVSLSLSQLTSATLTFGLKVIPHIPVFHIVLMTRYQRGW